jgi:hypothetical protein
MFCSVVSDMYGQHQLCSVISMYRGADKSLARPGRKQATATEEFEFHIFYLGARGGVVGKALRYEAAGRGFDSRWCYWNFSVT